MSFAQYSRSFGVAKANQGVTIREAGTSLPATVMSSSLSGVISYTGNVNLDGSGNLNVYLDNAKTWIVTLDSGISTPGIPLVNVSSFDRPGDTTAYASGDLVANSTTNTSVGAMSFIVGNTTFRRLRLRKTTGTITNASFRVHLFAASPTSFTNGDNGAFVCNNAPNYIGYTDIATDQGFSDGAVGSSAASFTDQQLRLNSGNTVYAVLEARAAYVPGNGESFYLTLESI